jgi:enoyl-CoA hydratase/carnithine racemase
MTGSGLLREERNDCTLLRISRSAQRNALDLAVMSALTAELERPSSNPVVICGDRATFSSGVDMRMVHSDPLGALTAFVALLETSLRSSRPVVAAVEGMAIGGGWLLSATADLVICPASTRFSAPEVRIGIPPFVGAALLKDVLGPALWARSWLAGMDISAEELSGIEAVQLHPDPVAEATSQASRFAAANQNAFAATKAFTNRDVLARLDRARDEAFAFLGR